MFWDDLEHSKRMWKLRVKIDSWSRGVDEGIRERNRNLLEEAYLRSPPWRFWLYMKVVKYFHLVVGDNMAEIHNSPSKGGDSVDKTMSETDDIIALCG